MWDWLSHLVWSKRLPNHSFTDWIAPFITPPKNYNLICTTYDLEVYLDMKLIWVIKDYQRAHQPISDTL